MANTEHLKIIQQGTDTWNAWRAEYPGIQPDLSNADLSYSKLGEANFDGTNLEDTALSNAYLFHTNLSNANLRRANLSGADLSIANLVNADLTGAILFLANLFSANLNHACLRRATLFNTNLTYALLDGANLSDARLSNASFCFNDLSFTKGLDAASHSGPSDIGIATLVQSKGRIPKSFLRGAGIPDIFIDFLSSLVGVVIDFHSCFISYSTLDRKFAEQLHRDLQDQGVRCWFAPEDMRIGERFRERIDESIRIHDKFLLILSEHSVSSQWVEEEVESAMERERLDNRPILFPIRMDDAVLKSEKAWVASLRRTRHIGDFTQWKDPIAYKNVFDRLLRDLRPAA
jgi:hypothetical protein